MGAADGVLVRRRFCWAPYEEWGVGRIVQCGARNKQKGEKLSMWSIGKGLRLFAVLVAMFLASGKAMAMIQVCRVIKPGYTYIDKNGVETVVAQVEECHSEFTPGEIFEYSARQEKRFDQYLDRWYGGGGFDRVTTDKANSRDAVVKAVKSDCKGEVPQKTDKPVIIATGSG